MQTTKLVRFRRRSRRPDEEAADRALNRVDPSTPPALPANFRCGVTLRYRCTSASATNIYWRSFANLIVLSTSTTAGFVPYDWIKPKSLTIRGPAATLDAATGFVFPTISATMYYKPNAEGASQTMSSYNTKSDTATNERGSFIKMKFPLDKSERLDVFGITALTNCPNAVVTTCPIGTLLDLKFSTEILPSARTSLAKTASSAGATANVCYYNYLDCLNSTGGAGSQFWTPSAPMNSLNVNAQVWL
jgi:hypothetical protein